MPASDMKDPDPSSKSQLKREAHAVLDLVKELLALPQSKLEKIPLPEEILTAIRLAHNVKAHGAKKRQLQYIGKLMREVDAAPIQEALSKIKVVIKQNTAQFHQIEHCRNTLIAGGDVALQKFCETHPTADRQNLRRLIRKAQNDRVTNKNTGGETELFRCLVEIIKE